MKLNLDLAEKSLSDTLSSPSDFKDKKFYPTLRIVTDEKIDFPKEGRAVIEFKKTAFSMSERDNGKTRYECTLEVRELVSVEGKKDDRPAKSYDEAGDALDKIVAAKSKKKNSDDEEGY